MIRPRVSPSWACVSTTRRQETLPPQTQYLAVTPRHTTTPQTPSICAISQERKPENDKRETRGRRCPIPVCRTRKMAQHKRSRAATIVLGRVLKPKNSLRKTRVWSKLPKWAPSAAPSGLGIDALQKKRFWIRAEH